MTDASRYVLTGGPAATLVQGRAPYGLIPAAAVAIKDGLIDWIGAEADLPDTYADWDQQDLEGRLLTPALIDCHTHLVFGGDRAREFEMRLNGASYAELARAGGGIVSTVSATRAASEQELVASALPRLDALIAEGITTVEIKSGYGLDREAELTMLRAARRLGQMRLVTVITTFLGAHAVPPEYTGRAGAYLQDVCLPTLRAAHDEGLVDAVDGFCENIAFSPAEIEEVLACAQELGLPVKLHAEQLSHQGGTALAARYGALSVDHLEYANAADAAAMAGAGSVATILPGAYYTIRETQAPPIALFRDHGVPMALATDCNPGSSPMTSLLMAMNMGCTLFRMTPEETLAGVTCHAAQALGLSDRGRIAAGLRADLAIWNVSRPAELSYRIGFNPLHARIFEGRP